MDRKAHWEAVYRRNGPEQVSWFQPEARLSRNYIESVAPDRDMAMLDVGAGASVLIDALLESGYRRMTVLDLSSAALRQAQERLGSEASARVTWLEADVLTADLPFASFDMWHDRAAFHFLTAPADRDRYVAQVRRALRPGGHVLVATFADDGPERCSGLDVCRYSPAGLQSVFGSGFHVVESRRDEHRTPRGAVQAFTYCLCRYEQLPAGN